MQRLQFDEDEKLTRKEYLKRKKQQAKNLKQTSKITYIVLCIVAVISIYLVSQIYVYSKENNFKYVEDDGTGKQKVYNVYYVTEGYTYNPVYTLNSIYSNGFEDKVVYSNSGLTDIKTDGQYIYGTKEGGLYRLKKGGNELEPLIEKELSKYVLDTNQIYFTQGTNNVLKVLDLQSKEIKEVGTDNINEVLIDSENLFVVKDEKTKKVLYKIKKENNEKIDLTKNSNVSYIIQDTDNIYYVNKNDSNKIYYVSKNGGDEIKISDIMSVSDKGEIKEVDGSKYMFINDRYLFYVNIEDANSLYKINLDDKSVEKVIPMSVELLQNIGGTVFYKIKGEMGVYLYNYETNFISQVTKRKIKEFLVDNSVEIENSTKNTNGIGKN
mgnify:CR=1 FL=1